MKIINFGSLNIDRVYSVSHIVLPGETITARELNTYAGGKGLNQSIAAGRAGADICHMGAIGNEGQFLADMLSGAGADISALMRVDGPSGHAIIQVDENGQNSIVIFGGANRALTGAYVKASLDAVQSGDYVLLQNETSETAAIIKEAADRGARVVFNPSPLTDDIGKLPLESVSMFILNEIEGAQLAAVPVGTEPKEILEALHSRFPNTEIILTLGSDGVICHTAEGRFSQGIFKVKAVDTTAAGDTFCGYFLACRCKKMSVPDALRYASAASAITVSRAGAAPSIPTMEEVRAFLAERD